MTCPDCQAEVPALKQLPSPYSDEGWAALVPAHKPDCDWIATRAHQMAAKVPEAPAPPTERKQGARGRR